LEIPGLCQLASSFVIARTCAVRSVDSLTLRLAMMGTIAVYARQPMGENRARSSEGWLEALHTRGAPRDQAIADLHALLVRAARFELRRRRAALSHVRGEELEDIALQAADDALMAVLSKLDDYRGASRFTTWAYKFALLEAGVKLRRRAWQGREVVLEPDAWPMFADAGISAQEKVEGEEMFRALRSAIEQALTPHQRTVFVALALGQVPIDVLAERLGTTRGALYKTLHDARRKLRSELAAAGYTNGAALPLRETR
jgi:RNA polymerase sigma-70 factor, ECF subfamily